MANPFTYSELHSKDVKRARAFYSQLFDWKLAPVPVPGREYLMVEAGGESQGGLTVLRDPAGASVGIFQVRKR